MIVFELVQSCLVGCRVDGAFRFRFLEFRLRDGFNDMRFNPFFERVSDISRETGNRAVEPICDWEQFVQEVSVVGNDDECPGEAVDEPREAEPVNHSVHF